MNPEQTGEKFNLEKYFRARNLCKSIVARIADNVTANMNEGDGQQLIKEEFKKEGIEKFWHPSKFRIGADTLKSFRELPDSQLLLLENELFFIDVGPVIDEHEADYGETFIFKKSNSGDSRMHLVQAAEQIWQATAKKWSEDKLSGQLLYEAADQQAGALGYNLNPKMAGHRLGDFPHALFSKEGLSTQSFTPAENLWVLEIHILSERLHRGAFYEDILSGGQ